jgi:transposase-like protein
MKKLALHMYLEGLGFRAIGRLLGVSNVSVLNWIRSFGKEVKLAAFSKAGNRNG